MMQHWRRSVFDKIADGEHPNYRLAMYFHRSACIMYGIYAIWGVFAFIGSIPTFSVAAPGFQETFGLYVVPAAALSAIGAAFFPKTARLELYASSALIVLVLVYLIIMLIQALSGDVARATNFVLNLAHLVIPIARCVFTYRELIRRAARTNKES